MPKEKESMKLNWSYIMQDAAFWLQTPEKNSWNVQHDYVIT